MKKQLLIAAFLLSACCGCKSSSPLLSWMGHDNPDTLTADSSTSEAKLPPPTNVASRNSPVSVSSLEEHLQLGEAELNLGRFHLAKSHFESVLKEQPQHIKANHRMGVLCDKLGDYVTAERHYRLALVNDPQNVAILSDLGYSYWLQGRYTDCERLLLQAREIDPQYKNAIANLGMLYGTTGRQQEALALFRQIGDESAAQDIMQQVAAMTPPNATPAVSGGSMSAVTLANHDDQSAFDSSRTDYENANEPTRKILDLMEEGRRQQVLAEQERANAALASRQRQLPPFVQNRPVQQHGYQPQMAGVDPFHGRPGQTTEQPRIPDEMLGQALNRIDQYDRRPPQEGPITLGPNTNSFNNSPQNNLPQYGAPQTGAPQYNAAPQQGVPVFTGSGQYSQTQSPVPPPSPQPGYNTPGTMPQLDAHMTAQPQQPVNQPRASYEPAQPTAQQASPSTITYGNPHRHLSPAAAGYPAQHPQPNGASHSQSPSDATIAVIPQSNGVRQASGTLQQQVDPMAATGQQGFDPSAVEYAHHQQHLGVQTPIELLGAAAQPNAPPPLPTNTPAPATPGSQWPLIPSGNTDPNDPYQQARRQAALMGLEAGPGQMFPYVQQTNRAAPGASSMLNGAQYPQPQRQLPYGMNPADLAPSVTSPQATNLTPGQNYQGQHLPQVAAPMNTPTQFGAPSSVTYQQYQQTGYEGPSATTFTQQYEDVRQQSAQQLSGMINQTYGQPVQTPPSGIAALPSQTYHAPQNPALTQYDTPQYNTSPGVTTQSADSNPPARWTPPQLTAPTTQSIRPTEYNAPQPQHSDHLETANSSQDIVVPERYPAATSSGYQSKSPQPNSTSSSQHSGGLPMIVPGNR